MRRRSDRIAKTAPDRTFNLSGGVFSIAMTLLVFGLAVSVVGPGDTLARSLLEMWPEFLLYGLSFLILGVLGMMHHAVFDNVAHSDTTLGWMNICALMLSELIPFSTSLVWPHGTSQSTALVHGAKFLAGSCSRDGFRSRRG